MRLPLLILLFSTCLCRPLLATSAACVGYAAMATLCPEVGCSKEEALRVNQAARQILSKPDVGLGDFNTQIRQILGERKLTRLRSAAAQSAFQNQEPIHALPWLEIELNNRQRSQITDIEITSELLDLVYQRKLAVIGEVFKGILDEGQMKRAFGEPKRLAAYRFRPGSAPKLDDTYDAELLRLLSSVEVQKHLACNVEQSREIHGIAKAAYQNRVLPPLATGSDDDFEGFGDTYIQASVSPLERAIKRDEIASAVDRILDSGQYQRLRELVTQHYAVQGYPDLVLSMCGQQLPAGTKLANYEAKKMYLPALLATVERLMFSEFYLNELSRILHDKVICGPPTRICTSIRLREFPDSRTIDQLMEKDIPKNPRRER